VDISECRLQPLMQQARDAVAEVLENCSLAQLASRPRSKASRASERRSAKVKSVQQTKRPAPKVASTNPTRNSVTEASGD
jgi:hypothetical protein